MLHQFGQTQSKENPPPGRSLLLVTHPHPTNAGRKQPDLQRQIGFHASEKGEEKKQNSIQSRLRFSVAISKGKQCEGTGSWRGRATRAPRVLIAGQSETVPRIKGDGSRFIFANKMPRELLPTCDNCRVKKQPRVQPEHQVRRR